MEPVILNTVITPKIEVMVTTESQVNADANSNIPTEVVEMVLDNIDTNDTVS